MYIRKTGFILFRLLFLTGRQWRGVEFPIQAYVSERNNEIQPAHEGQSSKPRSATWHGQDANQTAPDRMTPFTPHWGTDVIPCAALVSNGHRVLWIHPAVIFESLLVPTLLLIYLKCFGPECKRLQCLGGLPGSNLLPTPPSRLGMVLLERVQKRNNLKKKQKKNFWIKFCTILFKTQERFLKL